jgi:hypothetical protein
LQEPYRAVTRGSGGFSTECHIGLRATERDEYGSTAPSSHGSVLRRRHLRTEP